MPGMSWLIYKQVSYKFVAHSNGPRTRKIRAACPQAFSVSLEIPSHTPPQTVTGLGFIIMRKPSHVTQFWRHADNLLFFVCLVTYPVEFSLFCNENISKVNIDNSLFRCSCISEHPAVMFLDCLLQLYQSKKWKTAKKAKESKIILHPYDKIFSSHHNHIFTNFK